MENNILENNIVNDEYLMNEDEDEQLSNLSDRRSTGTTLSGVKKPSY